MSRVLRLLRTIRYVRTRQLLARLRLMLRRKWRERRSRWYRNRMVTAPLPDRHVPEAPPGPVFSPRGHLVRINEGTYTLTFLNASRSFTHPFEWHPADLEHGTRLWLLNLHYMEFLEGLPDHAFIEVVEDWITHVPPYRQGYWLDDWNSYALSIRAVVWMQQYAVRRASLPQPFTEYMLASLVRQMRFLERNLELDIGGNHLVKNIKALLWAGRFWSHEEAEAWFEQGQRLLSRELEEQLLPDGMHYERSPAYHAQVFADILDCYTLLPEGALKDTVRARMRLMAQVLVDLTHPDGGISLFNDGGLHMTYAPRECLQVWQDLTAEEVRPRRTFAYEAAGYYGLRSEDELILVDCGQVAPDFLTAHGHGDIFSFEWTIAGQRFIVDAGVYEYNPGARRAYARSTRAHNTVTLDGLDQCEFWGAFRMARRARVKRLQYHVAEGGFTLDAAHDGYGRLPGKPVHQRSFDARPGRIHVTDRVTGGRRQRTQARLLLHPSCTAVPEGEAILIHREDIVVRLSTQAETAIEEAVWFPDFGVEQPCLQIVMEYGPAPCSGTFCLDLISR